MLINLFEDGIGKMELKGSFGDDLTVVNAARVSFGKGAVFAKGESVRAYLQGADQFKSHVQGVSLSPKGEVFASEYPPDKYTQAYYDYALTQSRNDSNMVLKPEDFKLINYLAKHQHMSPFRHTTIQFAVKVPEFVARQHYKHIIGCAYSGDGWNELSMRYTEMQNEFYVPQEIRGQNQKNKQCSSDVLENSELLRQFIDESNEVAFERYQHLIEQGVSRETARGVLPLNTYTQYYWTVSLEAACHFIHLRRASGAQGEIRELAEALFKLIQPLFPCSVTALLGGVAHEN